VSRGGGIPGSGKLPAKQSFVVDALMEPYFISGAHLTYMHPPFGSAGMIRVE